MNKIYAPYIIYKENSGFYNETKFHDDIDVDEFIKNKGIITSYYGYKVKAECINGVLSEKGNNIIVNDGKLVEITQDEVVKKITDLFIKLSYEAINAKYMDYKRDDKDVSIAENIAVMLNNFGYKVDLNDKKEFNEENYLTLAKELSLYTFIHMPNVEKDCKIYINKIKSVIRALNTTLAVNDVLNCDANDSPSHQFNIDSYENCDGILIKNFKYSSLEFYEARAIQPLSITNNKKKSILSF